MVGRSLRSALRAVKTPLQMPQISVGDEGYMVGGSTWYDNGSKGTDWGANLQDPNIAFGTVHLCEPPGPPCCAPCAHQERGRFMCQSHGGGLIISQSFLAFQRQELRSCLGLVNGGVTKQCGAFMQGRACAGHQRASVSVWHFCEASKHTTGFT